MCGPQLVMCIHMRVHASRVNEGEHGRETHLRLCSLGKNGHEVKSLLYMGVMVFFFKQAGQLSLQASKVLMSGSCS